MLVDVLVDAARQRSGVIAVSDQRLTLTYRKLLALARVMRDVVTATTQAQRIGVMLPASSAFCGSLFGILWASRIAVPLNFLLSKTELSRIVSTAGLDTVLTIKHFAKLSSSLSARTVFLEDLPLKRKMLGAMLRRRPALPAVAPDDTAVLLFTAGTSGDPKGVELTYDNLLSNCRDCIATAKMTSDQRFLNCLPPFHVFGLTACVIAPVVLGSSAYCIPRFSATAVAQAIREQRISIFMAIPSMFGAILRLKSAPDDLMKDVYLLVSGGEPLPETIATGFRERFGVELLQGYGLTETSPVCTIELPWARQPGSIGRPIRNVSVRIVDSDGRDLAPGGVGEIWVKGPNVMKGYYHDPEATRRALEPDGWFKTGDCGRRDAEGFVTITGRLKEMLIIGGENVFPREIEVVLERHPAVAEAVVIGAPDPSRGQVPVAFVTCKEGASAGDVELREFARRNLAGYKVPRRVRIEPDLPRSPTGKVLKRKLAELL